MTAILFQAAALVGIAIVIGACFPRAVAIALNAIAWVLILGLAVVGVAFIHIGLAAAH